MGESSNFLLIFLVVWLILGIIFFAIGKIVLSNIKKKELKCTSKTYGKVIDLVKNVDRDTDGHTHITWHPVFEYNIDGLDFAQEYSYGSSKPKFAVGQEVEIYYNPQNHNEYYISGDGLPKSIAKIFIIFGIIMLALSVLITVFFVIIKTNIK